MNSTRSKFRKGVGTNRGDIITDLPDCVLSCILSSLPIKDAVRTSVLSSAWENKWTSIYNIDINDRFLFSKKKYNNECFVNFMDWIILNIRHVRNFCFEFNHHYDDIHIRKWISAVFRHNVERVAIRDCRGLNCPRSIIFSRSFVNCTSLRELRIDMVCTLNVSGKICFPNLTELYLEGVRILNENSCIDTLACTFPVLETLQLIFCQWLNVKFVEIHAPALSHYESVPAVADQYIIKFIGARLAKFLTCGSYSENVLLIGSTVVHAGIKLDIYGIMDGIRVRRLLNGLSSLEELDISSNGVEAIVRAKQGLPLLKFDKLRRLRLPHISGDGFVTEGLFEVLHSAPYLKFLAIYMSNYFYQGDYDYGRMESVPSCVVSCLEEVKLDSFSSTAPQLDLVTYLLKVGARLKKFCVSCVKGCNADEVRQLLGFPTASSGLTIVIT